MQRSSHVMHAAYVVILKMSHVGKFDVVTVMRITASQRQIYARQIYIVKFDWDISKISSFSSISKRFKDYNVFYSDHKNLWHTAGYCPKFVYIITRKKSSMARRSPEENLLKLYVGSINNYLQQWYWSSPWGTTCYIVDHNQRRTMASDTVDPIDPINWPLLSTFYRPVPPERSLCRE